MSQPEPCNVILGLSKIISVLSSSEEVKKSKDKRSDIGLFLNRWTVPIMELEHNSCAIPSALHCPHGASRIWAMPTPQVQLAVYAVAFSLPSVLTLIFDFQVPAVA